MKYVCLSCGKTFVYATKITDPRGVAIIETHVCPHCNGLNIDDYVEPQPDITSVLSVPIEDVDKHLKDGYVVKELYAKTATLVKLSRETLKQ